MTKENGYGADPQGKLSARVIKSIEGFEEIRTSWEKLSWHHFTDIDYFATIVKSREEIVRPHVLVLFLDGVPETIAVGRLEEGRIACKIGYKTIYNPTVRSLVFDCTGLLGNLSHANMERVVSEIENSLRQGEADVACFGGLRLDSALYGLALSKPGFFFRSHFLTPNRHWKMVLPPTYEAFFKSISSKHRYWINRTERLLRKAYPGQVAFKSFSRPEDVDRLCRDVEEVAKTTYQRGLGVGFRDSGETRNIMSLIADQGQMRGYILYIEGAPIAFWTATRYRKTLYLDTTGFNPRYRKHEPGTVLFLKVIESMYAGSDNMEEINFGAGDASYKQRFGTDNWEETDVFIFGRTLKGLKVNTVRSGTLMLRQMAERVLSRTSLVPKIKKYWRSRAAKS